MASMGPMQNFGGEGEDFSPSRAQRLRQRRGGVAPLAAGHTGQLRPIVKIEQAETFNSPRRFSEN
jgi:hypothetical protein